MRAVRIFVSSPSDAHFERMRVDRVVERLNGEFSGAARLETIRWEREYYKAHTTFQAQIPQAADCDIVIAILRHRLGSELPADFPRMPNGEHYPSGTAYEILTAIEARRNGELPDVYVFRNPDPPMVRLDDEHTNALITEQWNRLKVFFWTWFQTPEGHFKAAFHKFRSTDEFEEKIEKLLRQWLQDKVLKGRSEIWPIETKGSPFRGLAAFGPKHTPVFFGRSKDTAMATDALKDAAVRGAPFLLIVGASGSGKSSLARAGLVPRVTAPGVVSSVDLWRVAVMRPSEQADGPIMALAARLFDGASDLPEDEKGRPEALPEIAASDYGTPAELADLLSHAAATTAAAKPILRALDKIGPAERSRIGFGRPVRVHLLILIDQLEELFAADITDDERRAFGLILSHLAATGRVWIIATLRADLYAHFLKQPELLDLKTRGATYDLGPPGPAEMVEIVRGPAEVANLVYEVDCATGEALDERLLRDANPDMLPLLQFSLDQLFEQRVSEAGQLRLLFSAYEALGGLGGAIDMQAERAIASLGSAERASLAKLMRLLIAPGQDTSALSARIGFSIRSVPIAMLEEDPPLRRLSERLIAARILVVSGEGHGGAMRLAHQQIVESWARAREAVRENADYYRIVDDLKSQFRRWIVSGTNPSTLLPSGRPLAEAEALRRQFPEEVDVGLRTFIAVSAWKSRIRRIGLLGIYLIWAFIVVAMVAGDDTGAWHVRVIVAIIAFFAFLVYPLSFFVAYAKYTNRLFSSFKFMNEPGIPDDSKSIFWTHVTAVVLLKYILLFCYFIVMIGMFSPFLVLKPNWRPIIGPVIVANYRAFAISSLCFVALLIPMVNVLPSIVLRYSGFIRNALQLISITRYLQFHGNKESDRAP